MTIITIDGPQLSNSRHNVVEWFKNRGWSIQFINQYLSSSKFPNVVKIEKIIDTNGICTNLIDLPKFFQNLNVLAENPYKRELYGELPGALMDVRDGVYKALFAPGEDMFNLGGDIAAKRANFAAWALWESHKGKMYMSVRFSYAFAHKYDVDIEAFVGYTRKHATEKNMVIYYGLYEYEKAIEKMFVNSTMLLDVPGVLGAVQRNGGGVLDQYQTKTLLDVAGTHYRILQGGAGVGKTTVTSHLIRAMNEVSGVSIVCLAFTHKAKKCLLDKMSALGLTEKKEGGGGVQVTTIHSFVQTIKHEKTALQPTFMLIDETSMVDVELFGELAKVVLEYAVNGYQLLVVGDDMQLPPIGRGEVFRYLVSRNHNVNRLTKCYRVDKPDLFEAYERLRSGKLPKSTDNVKFMLCADDKTINSEVGKIINSASRVDFPQFIAWQNKDVYKINKWVQAAFVKAKLVGPESFKDFCKNDRVVYVGENSTSCTNATIGQVIGCSAKGLVVKWETGVESPYNAATIRDVSLAYCITVHKSQGSEYNNVVVPCYEVEKMMKCLDRRWLYTATTRAKQHVTVLATSEIKTFVAEPIQRMPLTNMFANA